VLHCSCGTKYWRYLASASLEKTSYKCSLSSSFDVDFPSYSGSKENYFDPHLLYKLTKSQFDVKFFVLIKISKKLKKKKIFVQNLSVCELLFFFFNYPYILLKEAVQLSMNLYDSTFASLNYSDASWLYSFRITQNSTPLSLSLKKLTMNYRNKPGNLYWRANTITVGQIKKREKERGRM